MKDTFIEYVKSAIEQIGEPIWNFIDSNVISPILGFFDYIQDMFSSAAYWIGNTWYAPILMGAVVIGILTGLYAIMKVMDTIPVVG